MVSVKRRGFGETFLLAANSWIDPGKGIFQDIVYKRRGRSRKIKLLYKACEAFNSAHAHNKGFVLSRIRNNGE